MPNKKRPPTTVKIALVIEPITDYWCNAHFFDDLKVYKNIVSYKKRKINLYPASSYIEKYRAMLFKDSQPTVRNYF